MSDCYCIWVVTPPDYDHSAAFYEVALGLQGGFQALGIPAQIITSKDRIKGKTIVLGANLLPGMQGVVPPPKSILFNLEQITPGSSWLTPAYLKLLKRYQVWDYSQYNINQLGKLGISKVTHCPIGFSEKLQRIEHLQDKDIDVLFYGSMNERRLQILEALVNAGLKAEAVFGVYGKQRDEMIGRSRIVLNIHYFPSKIFEIVRISYLLANRVCVVSEDSPSDSALESVQQGIIQAPHEKLVTACKDLIDNNAWDAVAQRGFDVFSSRRQSDYLGDALAGNGAQRALHQTG